MNTLRKHRQLLGWFMTLLMALWLPGQHAYADTLYRQNAGANTTLDTALFTPAAPGALIQNYAEGAAFTAADIIAFNNSITAATTFRVSNTTATNLAVGGLIVGSVFNGSVLNPGGAITIQNATNAAGGALIANTITLGAGGIDMSRAAQNLTISRDATVATNTMTLALSAPQTWSVNTGRTLTVSNDITTGGNALTIQGGVAGAGTVVLGSTTGAVTGGGALIINGMNTGAGNTVTLSGNNGAAGLGATTVAGGSTLNIDQSAGSQNKLNDTAALTLNRATLNLQGTSGGTETVGNLVLGGSGLNSITRSAGTGVLGAGAITRSAGAVLNVGTASIATTSNANVNGILGGWAVINQTDFATNAFAAVTASTTAENLWTSALNEVQTANVTLSGARAVNSLKFNGAGNQTFTMTGQSLNVTSGGIIRNQNFTTAITGGTLTAGGTADTVTDELFIWNNQNTMTISAVIANNGTDVVNLVKAGGGSLTLSGANTYTGTTTVTQGTLNFGDNAAGGNVAAFGAGDIINNGTIQINKTSAASAPDRTITNNISGAGALNSLRAGTFILSGNNTYYGDTTVSGGTLQADSTGGFSPNSRMVLNTTGVGAVNNSAGAVSVSALRGDQATAFFTLGAFDLTLSGVDPTSNGAAQVYQGIISGTGGLIKNGLYTQQFTGAGALSYTGATTVNAGILQTNKAMSTSGVTINNSTPSLLGGYSTFISNVANSLSTTATMNVAAGGATWQINAGFNQSIGALSGAADSRITLGSAATNLTSTAATDSTFGGVISGSGTFTKAGAGVLTLTGGNSYTGTTAIDGALKIGTANAVQVINDSSAVVIGASGVFDLNGNAETIGSLAGVAGSSILMGAGTLTVGLNNTSTDYAGTTSAGAGGLTKLGTGTQTLSGANAFTGAVNIGNLGGQSGGGLTIGAGGSLADTIAVRNAGWNTIFTVNNTDTVGSVTGTRNTTLALGTGAVLTSTYTNGAATALAATADSAVANGRIVRDIDTTQVRVGDIITGTGLNANSYVVQILDATTVLVNQIVPGTSPAQNVNFAPTVTATSILNSAITGLGGFTKDGTGLLILTGNSNHSGATTINAGDVQIGGIWNGQKFSLHDTLSDSSQVVFAATGTQNLNFANSATNLLSFERVGSLAGGSATTTINLTNGSNVGILAFGGDNSTSTFSGRFLPGASAGYIIKEGTGNFTWSNGTADVFDGPVVVENGIFTIAGAQGFDGSNEVYMTNRGTTLNVTTTGGDTIPFLQGGKGDARIILGTGTQPVGGLTSNYLTTVAPVVSLTTNLTVNENTAANLTTLGGVYTFNGDIQGAATLIKSGNHLWRLMGTSTNAFTGETQITAGTLQTGVLSRSAGVGTVSGSDIFGTLSTGTGLRLTGGVLDINGTSQTVTRINATSTGGTIQLVNGSLTLSNQNTQTTGTVLTGNLNSVLNLNAAAASTLSLTGNSTNFGGTINVGTNAALTLNRTGGALNSTGIPAARVNLNGSGTQLTVTLADTIGSLAGTGDAVLTTSLTLREARSGTFSATGFSGATSGAGALILSNYGGLTLSNNNASTGGVTLSGGSSLHLNYGAGNNILPTGALTLNGANLRIFSAAATPTILADTIASTSLNAGASLIETWSTYNANTAITQGNGQAGLNLGAITRAAGGTLNVSSFAAATTTTNVNGILGASGYATLDGSTWAVGNGAGTAISGLATGSYVNTFGTATANTDVIATGSGGDTNSIRFNTAGAFDVQTTATVVSSGGVLVTRSVGANTSTISAALSATGNELILHQHNPLGDLVLSNVAGTNTIITTAGGGKTLITNNISGTGATNIGYGYLQLGDATVGGSTAGMVGTGAILNNGTLGINRSNPVTFGTAIISGTGNIEQLGTGSTTLGGANTFAGRVTVRGGTLEITNNGGLGLAATSPTNRWANLTSVNTGGTLLLNVAAGGAITEVLNLDGGTLDLRSTVATTLAAPIVLTSDSTIHVSNPGAAVNHLITGEIYALPGADLTVTNVGVATPSTLVLAPAAITGSRWENTTINAGGRLQVGNNSRGFLGTGTVANAGTLRFLLNDQFYVLGNTITGAGTGDLQFTRDGQNNTGLFYLTGDLSGYAGSITALGTTHATNAQNVVVELGNDTYNTSFGSGALNVTSTSTLAAGGNASMRTHFNQDVVVSNTINLTPAADATTARNAQFIRAGLGNVTLSGTINLGVTNTGIATQRNLIQTEAGGVLRIDSSLSGTGANNLLRVLNNNIIRFGGSSSYDVNAELLNGNVWIFANSGTMTLRTAVIAPVTNVHNGTFNTGNTYLQKGTLVVGTGGVDTIHNDNDWFILNGGTMSVVGNETTGIIHAQRGSTVNIAAATTLTLDDNAVAMFNGAFTGSGNLVLGDYLAMYGTNTATGTLTLGTGTVAGSIQTANLTNAIGSFTTINLGASGNTGAANLEYVGSGETFTNNLNLSGTTAAVRITANGNGALTLSGNITNTGAGNKTLTLSGQTGGYFNSYKNTISGAITEGANVLILAMPNTGNDDRFGITSYWRLQNAGNDFSGAINVNVGMLEFNGDLGTGTGTTSVMGDLSVARTITLGANNFDGRRYDMFGSGDQLGDAGFAQGINTVIPNGDVGTIIFNDLNAGPAANLNNITWANPNTSTANTSGMQIINNGVKQVNLFNAFSFGTTGARVVVLDGSNTLSNTINGAIGNPTTSQATRIDKEGSGTWRLAGTNTYTGATNVNNGVLEISGGAAIADAGTVAVNASGGDGLYSGSAKLKVVGSETIGAVSGNIGGLLEIDAGQTLTIADATSVTFNGVISGSGNLTRTLTGGTARTQTLANVNTYTGVTTIGSSGTSTASSTLAVYYLANGGANSSIGASGNAATNLVFAANTALNQGGILTWQGFTSQSTDRLFTVADGTAGARINAGGQLIGTNAAALTFSNTGALSYSGTGTRTITLGGGTTVDNVFRPQITDNTGATSLTKADAGLWLLNPDVAGNTYTGGTTISAGVLAIQAGNALGTGTIAINGGAGTGLQVRSGITLTNNITNSTAEGGFGFTSGASVFSGSVSSSVNLRAQVDSGASVEFSNATAAWAGAGQLLKLGNGTMIMSGVNTNTGATFVRNGVLELNYATNNTSKLGDAVALILGGITAHQVVGVDANVGGVSLLTGQGGGTLHLNGGSHIEHISGLTLEPGSNLITRAGGSTATISLGAITRAVNQGTIDFGAGSIAETLTTNTNSILGGYATVGKASWATSAATQNVTVPWVDAGDTITLAGYTNGQTVNFSGTAPGGLTAGVKYYVVNATAGNFQVSTTLGGAAIPLTNSGAAATMNTTGLITALGTYATDTYAANSNTDVTIAASNTAAATQTNSLRFNANQATTLTLGAAFGVQGTAVGLQSGGILVTPAVGAFDTIINGAALQNAASTVNLDTIIHQHNTAGALQIDSVIQNNTLITAQGLTKTGAGKLFLNANNTFSGFVNLYEGEIQVGGTAAAPTTATNAFLSGSGLASGNNSTGWQLAEGTTLRFLTTNTSIYNTPGFNGEGKIIMDVGNSGVLLFDDDNGNWLGDLDFFGGTIRSGATNALGSVRGVINVANSVNLIYTAAVANNKVINYAEGTTLNVQNNTTTSAGTISGTQFFNNTTLGGLNFNIDAPTTGGTVSLNLSGLINASNGFTKSGNGILQVSATNFKDVLEGYTGANKTPSLLGQIAVTDGILYVGASRALGATGAGNETVVSSGATVDLRGATLNYGDDSDTNREIIKISGTGHNATGALRNSSGTGQVAFLTLDNSATINSGGTEDGVTNASLMVIGSFDTNTQNGSGLTGAFTRNRPVIEGNSYDLTIQGGRISTDNLIFIEPTFASALNSMLISEGNVRFRHEIAAALPVLGLTSTDITNGIAIGYAGTSLADLNEAIAGNGANTGSRLMFENYFGLAGSATTHNTVAILMDGATAATATGTPGGPRGLVGGANYLQVAFSTIPNGQTYFDGDIDLIGDANRNFLVSDSSGNYSVVEQGNTTVSAVGKMIVGGQITGAGGFTKFGFAETRLTANNTFSGDLNVVRFGTASSPFQSNTVRINGVDYVMQGNAEGWAEWGLTLNGAGTLANVGNITLQRRGMITLDNTTRLDATSNTTGANNNNRVNDAAIVNLENGWLRINGGTVTNTEAFGTVNINNGTNIFDLYGTDGSNVDMDVSIATLNRSAGGILRVQNLDATSTFSTALTAGENARLAVTTLGATQIGGSGAANSTTMSIVQGVLGGNIPLGLDTDLRKLGFNNGNVTDLWNQQRNLQFMAGSHFMTYESGFLRPLDDDEYFAPTDGILSSATAANQNVNLSDVVTIVKNNTTINSLRFGALQDHDGSGGTLNAGTTLTNLVDHHAITLMVDGTLKISSGMISSAYFTLGNSSNLATVIYGGALDFDGKEAILNNQNGTYLLTSGTIGTGNFEVRSAITNAAGLTKTGLAQVILDGSNTYTGLTRISDGTLFLRNGRTALGAGGIGNGVVITGNGNLNTGGGIQVGTAASPEDIYVGILNGDQQVMRTDNDLTNWFSKVTIDNVDATGNLLAIPRIRTDNSATAILNGNIAGGDTLITNDVVQSDSRRVSFQSAGNNVFIVRGQFGDRFDGSGNAVPVADTVSTLPTLVGTRTNENELLRVNLGGGSIETNFILDRQYNAAGRLEVEQGLLLVNYDPAAPGNDGTGFWTNAAISKIPNADSTTQAFATNGGTNQQGFILTQGGGGTINNNGAAGVLLTRSGQVFNMASWTMAGTGAKYIGGINESGTVTFGTGLGSLTVAGQIPNFIALDGGTVVFDQRITGNVGTAPSNFGFVKQGRGQVTLQNSSLAAAGDSNFVLAGGTLLLNHTGTTVQALVGGQNARFDGGTVIASASTGANTTTAFATNDAADRVLNFSVGGSEIIARGNTGGRTMTLNLGNANANNTTSNFTRGLGATTNLVEDSTSVSGSGAAQITLNFNASSTAAVKNQIIPWATYGTLSRTATDFAMSDVGSSNDIRAYTRALDEYNNNVTTWAANQDVSENAGSGFSGTLGGALTLSTLRFDANADSVVNLGTNVLTLASTSLAQSGSALLVSSNVGSSNKTITGGVGAGLTASGGRVELIMHHFGTGNLNVNVPITGAGVDLVIAGPSTTNAATIGTTGAVVLGATNTYDGQTFINGSVLSFSNANQLGTNAAANAIVMNGGTLRYTGSGLMSLGTKGIDFQGNGGTLDVTDGAGELYLDTAVTSTAQFRGDLIKVGAGTLTLNGSTAAFGTAGNPGFLGLIDVRQGTLRVAGDHGNNTAGNGSSEFTTMLGSSVSYADGTIFRTGTNLAVQMSNANDAGTFSIAEWLTFEGSNYVSIGTINTQTANTNDTATAGVLNPVAFNPNNERAINFAGVNTINGSVIFDVVQGQTFQLNGGGAGYTTGSGTIIKDGQGTMTLNTNNPDFTGNLVINQGRLTGVGQADVLGTGTTITLGSNSRQGIAELAISSDNIQGQIHELDHNINVVYNPAQSKRVLFETFANSSTINWNGNVTLNDNLQVYINDAAETGGSQNYVTVNGSFSDGTTTSGNLVFASDDTGGANDNSNGRTYNYLVLKNNNSAWTGDVRVSIHTGYDQDETAILRLEHASALTAANDVDMGYNSILQAGGGARTIGALSTNGGTGPFIGGAAGGTMGASSNGTTVVIENAASTAGTLTITQSTPVTTEVQWNAHFRDGTLNSQFFAPGVGPTASAALNIEKAGAGWATITTDNNYTGTTLVSGGTLQVGRGNVGDTGAASGNAGFTSNAGTTVAGTGLIHGTSTILGNLKPGDEAGGSMGTLTFTAATTLGATSVTTLQVQRSTYTAFNAVGYNDPAFGSFASSLTTDPTFSHLLNDPVTTSQHDKLIVTGGLTASTGAKITLVNNGYNPTHGDVFNLLDWTGIATTFTVGGTADGNGNGLFRTGAETGFDLELFELGGGFRWDVSLFNSAGILVVVVPEPSRALLLLFGLLGLMMRRRRQTV